MSKIGRKPIFFNEATNITVVNNVVSYKGKEASGSYIVPVEFEIILNKDNLVIMPTESANKKKNINMLWGLHRALLNNVILGCTKLFEKQLRIEGLGFKAEVQGKIITFSLGFSHKIEYSVIDDVTIEIDKTKQNLTLRSAKKDILGHVADEIRRFKPVEPYKGKGIYYSDEKIIRKAGKTK
jgi:large subunit ribosomal protein L6